MSDPVNGQGARERELELELERARAELLRLREERAVLADLVLHDVRGTLASLRWTFEVLRRESGDEPGMLGHADAATAELLRVIDGFAAANKAESRYLEVSGAPVDLRTQVDRVVERFGHATEAAGVTLTLDNGLASEPAIMVSWLVERMLTHLLANAIDAGAAGAVVHVRAQSDDEYAWITIEDEGPGISAELAELIYEPYFSRWREDRGAGLGLAVCRLAARLLGASIEHRAREPGGTAVVLKIPF